MDLPCIGFYDTPVLCFGCFGGFVWDDLCMTTGFEGLAYPPVPASPGRYSQRVNEVLDYSIDYSDELVSGDGISASVWQCDEGLVLSNKTHTGSSATVWVSGGKEFYEYNVVNTVTTTGGRVIARKLVFVIRPLGL